jgi:hypothetical protein
MAQPHMFEFVGLTNILESHTVVLGFRSVYGLFAGSGSDSPKINYRYRSISVADPGCFIPDPGSDHCFIPDPGGKKAPDPGSDLFLYKGY